MRPFFPLFIDLTNRDVLVVGGGFVATEKVGQMMKAQARVTVVSPDASEEIHEWARRGQLSLKLRPFRDEDLGGYFLVITGTNDDAVNARVFKLAEGRCMFANSIDDLDNCNFIMGAVAQAGPLQVAVSSGGASPTLAGRLRDRFLREMLDEGMDTLAAFLGTWRQQLSSGLKDFAAKRRFWRAVMDSPIPDWVTSDQSLLAEQHIIKLWETETGSSFTVLAAGSAT